LRELGSSVHTVNFALPGTQDYLFGNEFAAKAGTIHEAIPKAHGDLTPDYSSMMARAWNASRHRKENPAQRPALAWSGEGGSVALGHVHLSAEIVELMRAGKPNEAIEAYLQQEHASVTQRLLNPEIRERLSLSLLEGIREELDSLRCSDPGRSFYLYLMLNDQRRKLSDHFENIDLHRLELQLPFFDSKLLAIIVSLPIDLSLRHMFYVKWLRLFSPLVTEVPWQAYPGHEPCPVPVLQDVAYQWDKAFQSEQTAALKQKLLNNVAKP